MSEDKKKESTSGDSTDTSGSGGEGSKDTVSREAFEKLRKELGNYRAKSKELEDKISAKETEDLEAQKKFERLYQDEKKKNETLQKSLDGLQETTKAGRKKEALSKELFSLGLDEKLVDDALRLADLENVTVDTDTQTIVGAKEVAKKFHEKYQHLGFFKKSPGGTRSANHSRPNLTTGNPDGLSKPISEMSQAEIQEELRKRHTK